MRVIRDNKELQGVMRGSRGSQESTRGYRGFQLVKGGLLYYWWLQGLLGITGGFYLIWNYSLLLAFYLQNISFFNFSVLLETVIKD